MSRIHWIGAALVLGSGAAAGQHTTDDWGKLPLCFEQNLGQADPGIRFQACGGGGTTSLCADALVFESQGAAVRLEPLGGSLERAQGETLLETRVHYQRGDDPTRWVLDVPCFESVRACDVWPGIDLVLYGNARRAEYDLMLAPGADPRLARFAVTSEQSLALTASGALAAADGTFAQCAPIAYQLVGGARLLVPARFVFQDGTLGFELGDYDRSRELVIDPMWLYANLIGGSGRDMAYDIATDSQGTSWVCGEIYSAATGVDAFVAKINTMGTQLVWKTVIAGSGNEAAYAIALEPTTGIVFVTGYTTSSSLPGVSAAVADNSLGGTTDAFLTKVASMGTVDRTTYLGGPGEEVGNAIALETSTMTPFVTGYTTSSAMGFPTTVGALDRTHNGGRDVFVTKSNGQLSSFPTSTLIGGPGDDSGSEIQLVNGTLPVVCGTTNSAGFPGANGMMNSLGGNDVFVLRLNSMFGSISNSKRVGGAGDDRANGMAIDSQGTPIVIGYTNTGNLATVNAFQPSIGGGWDALLFELDVSMQNILFLTYFGGAGGDTGTDVVLDSAGGLFFTGNTESTSPSFQTVSALQAQNAGGFDGWLAHINTGTSNVLRFSTFFGTSGHDAGFGLCLDGVGLVYIGGYAGANWSPTTTVQEFDQTHGGGMFDALAVRVTLN